MKYHWKAGSRKPKQDAQRVGETIASLRTENGGNITSAIVVSSARPPRSALHKYFEWNNTAAADKYREYQAGDLIRSVCITIKGEDGEPITTRAFVTINEQDEESALETYIEIGEAMRHEGHRSIVLANALRELASFRVKYAGLKEVSKVIKAIDSLGA